MSGRRKRVAPDPSIGYRAAECVRARWGTPIKFERATNIEHKAVHCWGRGQNPSAQALQTLCEWGIDVIYILTGRLHVTGGGAVSKTPCEPTQGSNSSMRLQMWP